MENQSTVSRKYDKELFNYYITVWSNPLCTWSAYEKIVEKYNLLLMQKGKGNVMFKSGKGIS